MSRKSNNTECSAILLKSGELAQIGSMFFFTKEADERIQFGVATSYSDGIGITAATGDHTQLMNLLISLAQFCNTVITYSTDQVTKNAEAGPHFDGKIRGVSYLYCIGPFLVVVYG